MSQTTTGLRHAATAAAALCVLAGPFGSKAEETSGTNFPVGVNTALSAIYPPAGATEYFNYNLYYSAGAYPTTGNNPGLPPFHTSVFVEAVRINHTWINLGPDITFGSGFALNFVDQTINIARTRYNGGLQFADPDIIPYNIGFHVLPNLWVSQMFDVFPDWGQYSRNDVVNTGLGYATYSPELAVTYLTRKLEVSLDAHYDFNSRNTHTDYQSGQLFDVDYVVGYRPVERYQALQLGLNGYLLEQTTDDTQAGRTVGTGNRSQVLGYGPLVRYDIGHGGLLLKWQHEAFVENRTKGDRIWFQFAIPL